MGFLDWVVGGKLGLYFLVIFCCGVKGNNVVGVRGGNGVGNVIFF